MLIIHRNKKYFEKYFGSLKIFRSISRQILSGGKVVEGECTTFFRSPHFLYLWVLNLEKLILHSPGDQHTHDMLVFFVNLIIGPELAPPVHVYSSLPVLYHLLHVQNLRNSIMTLACTIKRSTLRHILRPDKYLWCLTHVIHYPSSTFRSALSSSPVALMSLSLCLWKKYKTKSSGAFVQYLDQKQHCFSPISSSQK